MYLLMLTLCTITESFRTPFQTAIATKQKVRKQTNPIALGAKTFKDLTQRSNMFVDNSLFIIEALQLPTQSYTIAPRKWGKTLLLDMLKTFLEIQVDENGNRIIPKTSTSNYKLFVNGEIESDRDDGIDKLEKPLLIAEYEDVVRSHLGNYPVIYVRFDDVFGVNHTRVKKNIDRVIRKAFEPHRYMLGVLRNLSIYGDDEDIRNEAKSNHDKFQQILNGDENVEEDSVNHIQFLSQVLHKRFKRKAFILFDDYDKPLANVVQMINFSPQDYEKISNFLDRFAESSMKTNKHMEHAFMSGTFELNHYGTFYRTLWFPMVDVALQIHPISRYYGFSRDDVLRLFELNKLPDNTTERTTIWYNGYKSVIYDRYFYNPSSMINFLKHKKIHNYNEEVDDTKVIILLLKGNHQARRKTLHLLSKQVMSLGARIKLGNNEISNVHSRKAEDEFMWYLLRIGYLALDSLKQNTTANYIDDIIVKVPNYEIITELSNALIKYYQLEYRIPEPELNEAANKLLEFANSETPSVFELERTFQKVYKQSNFSLPNYMTHNITYEWPINAIFDCIVLKMQGISKFQIDVFYASIVSAEYLIVSNRTSQAFIVQIDLVGSLDETLQLAKIHEPIVVAAFSYIKNFYFVAIKVTPENEVEIGMKMRK